MSQILIINGHFIGTSKSLQMVYRKQFSQPEYVIIFQTCTMSEILGRQTPTAVALEYTVHIHRDHNITEKNCQ